MEINAVTPSIAKQALLEALAELANEHAIAAPGEASAGAAVGADLPGRPDISELGPGPAHVQGSLELALGAGHVVERGPKTATAESDVVHPDARPDRGAESALVQSSARPDTSARAVARPGDDPTAAPALAGSEFALPADQLLNAAVIGMQVESSFAWQLQRRGFDATPQQVPEPRNDAPAQPVARQEVHHFTDHERDRNHRLDHDPGDGDGDGEARSDATESRADNATARCNRVPDDEPDDWPQPVSRSLGEALSAKHAPQALLAAAEQWRLGRCVVLACPQGSDPAGPAWAFVLWPRPGSLVAKPLALYGLRVDARLHWSRLPPALAWCHARAMKEQHPRQGRQLVALDALGTATVPCEVQLGPVPLRTPRWRDVCVRIDAARHFWSALGQQWSVTVLVGSRQLAGLRAPGAKEAAWET